MQDLLETNGCGLEIGKCRGAELEAHIIEDLPDPHHNDDLTQLLLVIRSRFARRARLEAENLLLRQELIVSRRQRPKRLRLLNIDRLLLVWLYRLYPSLLAAIIIVQPETVIRWHRRGFRAYCHWKSRHVGGRPRIDFLSPRLRSRP
jgi:hypothetical protein